MLAMKSKDSWKVVGCRSLSKEGGPTEFTSSDAAAVGWKVLGAFFTLDEIAKGNYTPSRHNLLDQEVTTCTCTYSQGIRSEFCYIVHVYTM